MWNRKSISPVVAASKKSLFLQLDVYSTVLNLLEVNDFWTSDYFINSILHSNGYLLSLDYPYFESQLIHLFFPDRDFDRNNNNNDYNDNNDYDEDGRDKNFKGRKSRSRSRERDRSRSKERDRGRSWSRERKRKRNRSESGSESGSGSRNRRRGSERGSERGSGGGSRGSSSREDKGDRSRSSSRSRERNRRSRSKSESRDDYRNRIRSRSRERERRGRERREKERERGEKEERRERKERGEREEREERGGRGERRGERRGGEIGYLNGKFEEEMFVLIENYFYNENFANLSGRLFVHLNEKEMKKVLSFIRKSLIEIDREKIDFRSITFCLFTQISYENFNQFLYLNAIIYFGNFILKQFQTGEFQNYFQCLKEIILNELSNCSADLLIPYCLNQNFIQFNFQSLTNNNNNDYDNNSNNNNNNNDDNNNNNKDNSENDNKIVNKNEKYDNNYKFKILKKIAINSFIIRFQLQILLEMNVDKEIWDKILTNTKINFETENNKNKEEKEELFNYFGKKRKKKESKKKKKKKRRKLDKENDLLLDFSDDRWKFPTLILLFRNNHQVEDNECKYNYSYSSRDIPSYITTKYLILSSFNFLKFIPE